MTRAGAPASDRRGRPAKVGRPAPTGIDRQSAKAHRRRRLIEAVFRCISTKGIVDTTVADIAAAAGVADGTVIQHFTSKQALLTEALRHLTREFDSVLTDAEPPPPADPAARLSAVVMGHLHPALCKRERLATWFAFWGEASARPIYRRLCRARDNGYYRRIERLVQDLAHAGDYGRLNVRATAQLLVGACEGLWLAMLTGYATRRDAEAALRQQLAVLFPRHFGSERDPTAAEIQ
jgi:TetR/AcrR family transcriptional repressor of bet genes